MVHRCFPECTLSAGALILWAAGILLLPLRWLLALLLAGAVHEAFHIAVLLLLRIPVHAIHIGCRGASISTAPVSSRQETLAAAAGPAGSLLLLVFLRPFPELALCGLVQGLYNLLPLYPSDGGRILRCILRLRWPDRTDDVMRYIRTAVLALLTGCAFFIFGTGSFLILLFFVLLPAFRKIPCKESHLAVQ